jgi:tripartite-type tricarboxylate transporter receptor subunit TctC
MVLVTRPSLGARDLSSLVALSKTKPDGLTYATPGNGSPQHLATALLGQSAGIQLLHVPYRGSGPAVTAALSGEVDLMFMPVHTAAPFIKEGRLNALMVSTAKRSSRLPNVPTAAELGVRNFDVDLWYAVVAPAGTAADSIKRMRNEVQAALKDPSVVNGFEGQGLEPAYLAPDAFTTLLRDDMAKWAEVIQRAKIVAD